MNEQPYHVDSLPESRSAASKFRPLRWILLFVGAIVVFAAGATAGIIADDSVAPLTGNDQETPTAVMTNTFPSTIEEAWALIHSQYVDTAAVQDDQLAGGAISGMLQSLGDEGHTRYLSPADLAQHQQSLSGNYVGVGIRVEERDGRVVVVAPLDESPAQEAGILPGDMLLTIDGVGIQDLSLTEVVEKVRGQEGSTVVLSFERPGESDPVTVTLERKQLRSSPVSWMMLPGNIAHIRFGEFSAGAAGRLEQAIRAAQDQGAVGIVLDLRNNPGGLVDEAIRVSSLFLEEATPVFVSQRRDGTKEVHRTRESMTTDLPTVVLVNHGSASSAEIVAGALKDNGRAKVVGETTFGTGTVLNQFPLSDGSAILLGTELWLTPSGELIRGEGVTPDVQVELGEGQRPFFPSQFVETPSEIPDDPQLQQSISVLEEEIGQIEALPEAA